MSIGNTSGYTFCAALLLASSAVLAAGTAAVRKQVEASMLVTGSIQVDGQGKVTGFSLDKKEKLPAGVVGLLDKAVPTWKFEPVLVAGRPADVTTDMSVRLVAKKLDDGNFSLGVRSASFGDFAGRNPKKIKAGDMAKARQEGTAAGMCRASLSPPNYPDSAVRSGVASNVYLLLKVDRHGRVLDAMAEQVNLKVVSNEKNMARWRKVFSDASLSQARKWCVPSSESLAEGSDDFVVRVPVMFGLGDLPSYGQWEAYVPGPRTPNPWDDEGEGVAFSPDTLLPGRAYAVGSGLKLLTDPTGI